MKKIAVIICLMLCSTMLYAETVDALINKTKSAMKYDVFKGFKTLKVTGSQFNAMLGQDMPIVLTYKKPNKIHFSVEVMGMNIQNASNGTAAWAINPLTGSNDPQEIPIESADQLLDLVDMIGTKLSKYGVDGYIFELDGTEEIDGKNYNKVKMTSPDEEVFVLYLDAITNWYYKEVTSMENEGETIKIEVIYPEKTRVKGAIVPSLVEVFVNGEKNSTMKFDTYEADIDVDDKIFNMP